jgi:hypothetical protein
MKHMKKILWMHGRVTYWDALVASCEILHSKMVTSHWPAEPFPEPHTGSLQNEGQTAQAKEDLASVQQRGSQKAGSEGLEAAEDVQRMRLLLKLVLIRSKKQARREPQPPQLDASAVINGTCTAEARSSRPVSNT